MKFYCTYAWINISVTITICFLSLFIQQNINVIIFSWNLTFFNYLHLSFVLPIYRTLEGGTVSMAPIIFLMHLVNLFLLMVMVFSCTDLNCVIGEMGKWEINLFSINKWFSMENFNGHSFIQFLKRKKNNKPGNKN